MVYDIAEMPETNKVGDANPLDRPLIRTSEPGGEEVIVICPAS